MILWKATIPIEPRTKKNHQMIVKGRLIQGQAYRDYEKTAMWFIRRPQIPIDIPVNVKATYYMATRRRVDLNNLHAALMDMLVKSGVLYDDNYKIVASTDGSKVEYDPENPRTEVEIDAL